MAGEVWFIGAGPGDPELVTVKGQRLIRQARLVLYAGSLVPHAVVADGGLDTKEGPARLVDSSSLTLEQTHALCMETVLSGGLVARVHTGDPSLYGAIREQMRLLQAEGVTCRIVPGVTAAFAAAAAAGVSFTAPEITQSLVITRLAGRTPVPERERLSELARHGSSMAVYLSTQDAEAMQQELSAYPGNTPVLCAYRVGWPDERIVRTSVDGLARTVRDQGFERQTVFLILPGESPDAATTASRLYDSGFSHMCRS